MAGIIEIKLGNEVRQLKFANYALEHYTKITGTDIGSIKQVDENYSQLEMTADIILCGLVGWCKSNGKVLDLTKDDIIMLMDDVSYTDQLQVIKEFMNSVVNLTNEMLKALKAMSSEGEEEKKK